MSRHRIVRSMNYEDEYYDDEEEYSRSVEDNYCISPSTAAQFTWNKERNVNFAAYMGHQHEEIIDEEGELEEEESSSCQDSLNDSSHLKSSNLSEYDQGRLNGCLEEIRNILGESVAESIMKDIIIQNNFNLETSLNKLLSQQDAPKPQRERRNRRNQSQEIQGCESASEGTPNNNIRFQPTGNGVDFSFLEMARGNEKCGYVNSKQTSVTGINRFNQDSVRDSTTKQPGAGHSKLSFNFSGGGGVSLMDLIKKKSPNQSIDGSLKADGTKDIPSKPCASTLLMDLARQHKSPYSDSESVVSVSPSNKMGSSMVSLSSLVAQHKGGNKGSKPPENSTTVLNRMEPTVIRLGENSRRNPSDSKMELSLSQLALKHREDVARQNKTERCLKPSHPSTCDLKNVQTSNVSAGGTILTDKSSLVNSIDGLSLSSCLRLSKSKDKIVPGNSSMIVNDFPMDSSFSLFEENSVGEDISDIVLPSSTSSVPDPSSCGLVFSCVMKRKHQVNRYSPYANRKKFPKFLCHMQVKDIDLLKAAQKMHKIPQFEFSSLSPDDIVKKKQQMAFTRPDKEFVINPM